MNRAFNKVIKSHVGLTVLTVLAVVLLTGGVTYSLFQTENINSKNQTIAVGTLSADMTSVSGAIVLNDLYPETADKITDEDKKYTFTISNTGTYEVKYTVYLRDMTETFLASNTEYSTYTQLDASYYTYINYKLDGSIVKNLEDVKRNSNFVILEGTLAPGTSEDHYLQFFIDTGDTTTTGAPNDMSGTIISLDITMDANANGTVIDNIIATANEGTPDFVSTATTDEGVYAMADNYGTSYYFRGAVENNYVKFGKWADDTPDVYYGYDSAGSVVKEYTTLAECQSDETYNQNCTLNSRAGKDMYWRIIRINGNGTVRMIYDGTQAYENGESNADRSALIDVAWNETNLNDVKYVGYMYGGSNGEASESKEQAQTNETSSNIKTELEEWYKTNIEDAGYGDYVADVIFCNDRSTASTSGSWWKNDTTLGYGANKTAYGAFSRFITSSDGWNTTNPTPIFVCPTNSAVSSNNDWFTKDATDSNKGNGYLDHPVGMITIDEVIAAGGKGSSSSETTHINYYLNKGHVYWTLSPDYFNYNSAFVFHIRNTGYLFRSAVNNVVAGAPVINLKGEYVNTMIGTGEINDPYRAE